VCNTLGAIANDESLVLFKSIALETEDSCILISRLELTRKPYYSRIFKLINAGLIRRKNAKYFLTSFGRIVYEAQDLIRKAVRYSSKLKVINSIKTPEVPTEERSSDIDTLINNSKIKFHLS
jgi:predicted transcriptional regulator